MTRAQGLSDFASGLGDTLKIDGNNNRVGINSTAPTQALDVVGNIKATGTISGTVPASSLTGALPAIDGSQLTGVSGFATALSTDQTSPLNIFFKTPKQVNIGAGTSISVESDATSMSDILLELIQTNTTERDGRLIDSDSEGSMEKKKKEGYF